MSKSDNTVQNSKVYLMRDAEALGIDSDGYFDFFTRRLSGQYLKKLLYDNHQDTVILTSALVMSTVNLPQNGFVFLNVSVSTTAASMWLIACSEGDELTVAIRAYALNSLNVVKLSTSGCTVVGLIYSGVSNITLYTSVASVGATAMVKLKCFDDGVWTVIGAHPSQLVAEASIT